MRKTALFFAVSNGDVSCSEMLLAAGARTDLDPLRCILVAVRAERSARRHLARVSVLYFRCWADVVSVSRYALVQLLLSYGAEVNCYFRAISNTAFPTALQYCLRDQVMLRLLLNSGYQAHKHVTKS